MILKGTDPRVETYSAFRSPLKNPPLMSAVSELADDLTAAAITDVLVVGLAGDYCVKCTALDSADQGWQTYVAGDGVRSVGGDKGWLESKQELEEKGVRIVDSDWVKKGAKRISQCVHACIHGAPQNFLVSSNMISTSLDTLTFVWDVYFTLCRWRRRRQLRRSR